MPRTVTSFRDPWTAHMLRTRLLAEDIPAFVVNGEHASNKWPISLSLGGVRVMVPPCRFDDARAVWGGVLDNVYRDELQEMFGDLEDAKCPVCGATGFVCRPSLSAYVFGFSCLLFFGVAIKMVRTKCTRPACGARWNQEPATE